jgi:pyrroloquinoline quinone (PQQ) biosynthesis protein C
MTGNLAFATKAPLEHDPIEAHPLFRRMERDELSPEEARAIALDVYHVVDAFPRFLAALLARIADHRLRMPIVENLYCEHGRMDPHEIHVVTYRAFLRALGLDDDRIDESEPGLPATVYVRAVMDLCARAPLPEALAALGVIEEIVARVSPIVGRFGLRHAAGRDAGSHFSVHESLDLSHADELYDLAARAAGDADARDVARGIALGRYYQRRLYGDLLDAYARGT